MYCERCRRLTEGDVCPECGKKCKREAQADDLCFLWSGGQIWADMAADVLEQEHIPVLRQGSLGAAMTVLTGLSLETYSLFVPFSHYDQAKEITDALFTAQDQEKIPDGDDETEQEEDESPSESENE